MASRPYVLLGSAFITVGLTCVDSFASRDAIENFNDRLGAQAALAQGAASSTTGYIIYSALGAEVQQYFNLTAEMAWQKNKISGFPG